MVGFDPPRDPLGRMVWRARRHSAVRRYLTRLPRKLVEDYGHRGPYRPKQVEASIKRHKGFSADFIPYAQALFCDEEGVRSAWREAGLNAELSAVRRDLATEWFDGGGVGGGGGDFSYADVGRYSAEHSWSEGHAGYGGDGGGHHGGGDGGHGGGH